MTALELLNNRIIKEREYNIARLAELEEAIKPWISEARAALESGNLYRGGGILCLAEIMREMSHLRGHLK